MQHTYLTCSLKVADSITGVQEPVAFHGSIAMVIQGLANQSWERRLKLPSGNFANNICRAYKETLKSALLTCAVLPPCVVCRSCSQLLLADVADEYESSALSAVLEGVVRRWAEADAAAAAGKACWWQMREAGLMAVRTCSSQLVQVSTHIHTHMHARYIQAECVVSALQLVLSNYWCCLGPHS